MSRVFLTNLQPSKKIVLLALADFANDDGKNIFPSVSTIAKKSSLSDRSVQSIISNFLQSGILLVTKNPWGGAPGKTRHLQIDLNALENLMRLSRDENFEPVSDTGADGCCEGVKTEAKTGETPAPKPSNIHHKTSTTTDDHPESSCGGETVDFDWPAQLDPDEREAIQAVLSSTSNSHQQKQFAIDELRAALIHREILLKAAWMRKVLEKGVERTPAGKAYDRSRKERSELNKNQSHKLPEPKTEVEKNADRERVRKIKEVLKK